MDLKNIEIIVSEIDGIITDGCDAIDYMNNTLFKKYCIRDFEAINELKRHFTFVFLAEDYAVNYKIMRDRNIPTYFSSNKEDKLSILTKKILPRYNTRPENLLYLGSSLSDIPCIHLSQISMVPATILGVASEASYQIPITSGQGIISYVANTLRVEMARRKCKE